MSEICDVVTIQTENGPVRINLSEYDPKVHKLASNKQENVFDREAAKQYLIDKNIKFANNITDKKLEELVAETETMVGM